VRTARVVQSHNIHVYMDEEVTAEMAHAVSKPQPTYALSNVSYDLVSTLAEDLEAVEVLDTYIGDCRQAGDSDLESLFSQIRDDEMRHCDMLRKAIEDRCRQGKFQ